jgi:ABC transporter
VSEPVLVVRARRLRAARGVVVASDVALTAGPGEVVAVEGPNGSGKSMLLAAAAGVLLALAALVAPLISQGGHPHPLAIDLKIVGLHLAAAAFGAGLGSLLALIERAGWRLLAAVALFLVLFVARATPMAPLLRLSTHPATPQTPIGGAAAWLVLPGLALVAAAAFLATRLT